MPSASFSATVSLSTCNSNVRRTHWALVAGCIHAFPGQPRFVIRMARQQQRRISKGAFGCAASATQAGNSSVQDNQTSVHGVGASSSLCNSSNWGSNMYEHSRNCRQSWDGRIYHRPSLLGTISRRQLKHSHTESIKKQTAARCYGCWLQRSQAVMGSCSQDSAEELELVSLLQVVLCFFPAICSASSTYMQPVLCKLHK